MVGVQWDYSATLTTTKPGELGVEVRQGDEVANWGHVDPLRDPIILSLEIFRQLSADTAATLKVFTIVARALSISCSLRLWTMASGSTADAAATLSLRRVV